MELIRDNYDKIKAWIASQELKPYEAYHVMWLKRRKDGVTDKGSHVGKHWFIHGVAELEQIKKSMLEHVSEGGRIVIGINRKDVRRVNRDLDYHLGLRELDGQFPFAGVEYPSIFDQCRPSGRGTYMIDVDRGENDTDETMLARIEQYRDCLKDECKPIGEDKVSIVLQSRTGYHVLFNRCDYFQLAFKYANVDIKKDGNTVMYVVA
jgi:hypothetical protein